MKKRTKTRKFNRKADPRKAFMKSLSRALVLHEKIETTDARAKELSSFIEKKITIAKKGDLSAIRRLRTIFSLEVTNKLIKEIAPLYKDREGGYTRIIKLGQRKSDGASMSIIEFIK
jgi:large subunit ribosomal protein L17